MLKRVEAETAEFEQCTTLLQAMRSVHARMLKDMLVDLSSDRLRDEVAEMQASMGSAFLNLGARKAFVALCERLRALLAAGAAQEQRDPRDAERVVRAPQRRVRLQPRDRQAARLRPLRERAAADREQLRPVPRPDAGAAPGAAEVHGAVPAHAGLQAARRVREREQRARALEQGGLGAGRQPSCASAARRSSGASRRSRRCRTRPASSRRGSTRSRPRTSACSSSRRAPSSSPRRLREHAFAAPLATDAALVKIDLPLFDDAVPVEEMEQRQA